MILGEIQRTNGTSILMGSILLWSNKKKCQHSTQIRKLALVPIKRLNIMILEKSMPNQNLLYYKKKNFVVNV